MKKTKMNIAKNIVAVVTALSLVFLQTPLVYAQPVDADEPDVTAAAIEEAPAADDPVEPAADEPADEPAVEPSTEGEGTEEGEGGDPSATDDGEGLEPSESTASEGEDPDPEASESSSASESGSEGTSESSSASESESEGTSESSSASESESSSSSQAEDDAKKDTKRVYTYSDSSIKVKATLSKASAIPDDAILKVVAVTPNTDGYKYDAYMDALNEGQPEENAYTAQNTLLYDVAFVWTDENGKTVELEPASGTVKLEISFRDQQITDGLGVDAEAGDTLEVKHLPLAGSIVEQAGTTQDATNISASDVIVENPVSASSNGDQVSVKLTSLSVISLRAQANGETPETFTFTLYGYDIGWFFNESTGQRHNLFKKTLKECTFENAVMAFDSDDQSVRPLLEKVKSSLSDGTIQYGETVVNPNNAVKWQVVGFVPFEGYTGDLCINGNSDWYCSTDMKQFFNFESEEAAKEYVTSNHGVLYGEAPTQEMLGSKNVMMTVWYQKPTKAPKYNKDRDYKGITPRPAVDYEATTSDLITSVEAHKSSEGGQVKGTVVYTIEIPETMDEDEININTLDFDNTVLGGFQPGDIFDYEIKVIDKAGKYEYKANSGAEGTKPWGGDSGDGIETFEGYTLPITTDSEALATYCRRGLNVPIFNLLKDEYPRYGADEIGWMINRYGYDVLLGDALLTHGYGSKIDESGSVVIVDGQAIPEDKYVNGDDVDYTAVVKDFLHKYYLDWFSENSGKDYTSFEQLDLDQMGILYKSINGVQAPETNAECAKALYWGFYEYLWPIGNGQLQGTHTWMQKPAGFAEADGNSFDAVISSQWDEDENTQHITYQQKLNGEYVANNMQDTKFYVGVQFKLKKKPSAEKFYFGDGTPEFTFSVYPSDDACNVKGDAVATGNVTVDAKGHGFIDFKMVGEAKDYEPGTYVVKEDPKDGFVTDEACYRMTVAAGEDGKNVVTYTLFYPNGEGELENLGDLAEGETMAFYNNEMVDIDSEYALTSIDAGEQVMVFPKAKKFLDGNAAIEAGRFVFKLAYHDGDADTLNELPRTGYNDENGDVAFYNEETEQGLVFTAPGTYRYSITEVADASDKTVNFDTTEIIMAVTVTEDNGSLKAAVAYTGPDAEVARFDNTTITGTSIKVQKVSREGGEGLADCTYGLWMKGPNGDAMIAQGVSDAKGWITFDNVSLSQDRLYYFKEITAPKGHLVDPYRTAYFSIEENDDGTHQLAVAEDTAADGWHAASYKD